MQAAIRVAVVDDHAVVRAGLAALLGRYPEFALVGEAGSVAEAIRLAERLAPDVFVIDVRLPDGSGVEACREIRAAHPDTRVVMLTSYPDEEAVVAAIMAGAAGFLLKDAQPDTLVTALRTVHMGGSLLDPQVATAVLGRMRGDAPVDPWHALTPQERDVLERITRGETNRQIGLGMHLSEKTIKHYVSNILDKVGVENRAAAAAWLVRHSFGMREGGPLG